MAFHLSSWFICVQILVLVSESTPQPLYPRVQGCSLIGMQDLQSCLVPIAKQTPFSAGSCCETLSRALEAGHFCLCTLLGSSAYPLFGAELQLSFSNCYINVPPLTHCHEVQPVALPSPAATGLLSSLSPPLQQADPLLPALNPSPAAKGEGFVPLPPGEKSGSSMVGGDPIPNSSPMSLISIPERWDYTKSDGGNVKMFVGSRNLLILVGFLLYFMRSVD